MPTTVKVKVKVQKTCLECGSPYMGHPNSKACSKACGFWRFVDRSGGEESCWPWTGHVTPSSGYGDVWGRYTPDGKRAQAHRVAWRFHNLCDPDKLFILHRCDNRVCCNPAHLRIGSQRANIMDGQAKGRITHLSPGEENSRSILTDAAVREIRSGGAATSALAVRFGVTQSAIRHVKRGLTWRHVA